MGRTWQGQAGDDRQAGPAGADGASPPGRSGIGVSLCSRVTRGLRGTATGRRRRTRRDRRRAAGRASAPPRRAAGLLTAGHGSSGVPVTAAVPGTRLPRTHLYGRDCVSQAGTVSPRPPARPRPRGFGQWAVLAADGRWREGEPANSSSPPSACRGLWRRLRPLRGPDPRRGSPPSLTRAPGHLQALALGTPPPAVPPPLTRSHLLLL